LFSQSGGTLPVLEDINDILEQKHDTVIQSNVSMEKKVKRQIEEEDDDIYYPYPYTNYLGQLNFQYTFGDGGGQDWVVSELFV